MQAPAPRSKFWDKMSQTLMQRGRFENMMHTALDLTLLVTFFYSRNWTWNLLLLLGMFECQYNFLLSCISFSWNLRPLWAQCLTSDGRLGKNYHDFQHTGLSAMGEASCTPREGWLVMSPPSMATSPHQKSGSSGCPWLCKFLAVSSDALPLTCLSSFPRSLLCSFASCCHPLFLFIESASFFFCLQLWLLLYFVLSCFGLIQGHQGSPHLQALLLLLLSNAHSLPQCTALRHD